MRIISKKEFLNFPKGTIYSKYEPNVFSGLYKKGESINESNDFTLLNLIGNIECDNSSDFVSKTNTRNTEINLDFDDWERDGLFEDKQLFAVYSREDVLGLIESLKDSLEQTTLKQYSENFPHESVDPLNTSYLNRLEHVLETLERRFMIDSKELRIGNWIYDTFEHRNCKVEGVESEDTIRYSFSNIKNEEHTSNTRFLDPIELTEEIIKSINGIEIIGDEISIYELCFEFTKEGLFFSQGLGYKLNKQPIKYLHKFQNIIFELTNKELDINL